jgi:hypothetical protein
VDKVCSVAKTLTAEPVGKYELTLVSHEGVPYVFPNIRDRIVEAMQEREFSEYDVDELYRRLTVGEAQLWLIAEKGATLVLVGITRVIRYPNVKRLCVDWIVGSDLEGCALMLDVVANWARQFGCSEIEASCRKGVTKAMRKHGFSHQYDVIVKVIGGSTH